MNVTVAIFATRETTTPTVTAYIATEVRTAHGGDLQILDGDVVLFTVDGRDIRNTLARVRIYN